jgi:hypothetical protein
LSVLLLILILSLFLLLFQLGKKRLKVQLKRSQDDNEDDASCNEDDSDVFYPTRDMQQGHHQSPRGQHPVRASRQTSCDSMASSLNDASTSGHTTRASTPRGGRAGSAAMEGDGGDHYFEGVDSDGPHSPSGIIDHTDHRLQTTNGSSEEGEVAQLFGQMTVQAARSTAACSTAVVVEVVAPLVIIPPGSAALQSLPFTPVAARVSSGGKKPSCGGGK